MSGIRTSEPITYTTDGTDQYAVAQPLYFQQNTWLKTALEPFDEGWHARMGFIYDTDYYKNLGSGGGNEGHFFEQQRRRV